MVQCQCDGCVNFVQWSGNGRKPRYCSEACKQKAKRVRAKEKRVTNLYTQVTRNKTQQKLTIVPCTIEQANGYVQRFHRHHGSIPAARLAFAVSDESGLIRGVAIIGRPCNTHLDDGWTLEVRRVCTDGCPNACSMLYGAAWKAAKAIGYHRLVTYTLPEEGGASLRAVGWKPVEGCGGKPWNHKGRARKENPIFLTKKTRWDICTHDFATLKPVAFPSDAAIEVMQSELLSETEEA
jgi:hypothetical protein